MDEDFKKIKDYLDLKLLKSNKDIQNYLNTYMENNNLLQKSYEERNNKQIENILNLFDEKIKILDTLNKENVEIQLQLDTLLKAKDSIKEEVITDCVNQLTNDENMDKISNKIIEKLEV